MGSGVRGQGLRSDLERNSVTPCKRVVELVCQYCCLLDVLLSSLNAASAAFNSWLLTVGALLLPELFTSTGEWLERQCFTHHPHVLCFSCGSVPSLQGRLALDCAPTAHLCLGGAICGCHFPAPRPSPRLQAIRNRSLLPSFYPPCLQVLPAHQPWGLCQHSGNNGSKKSESF